MAVRLFLRRLLAVLVLGVSALLLAAQADAQNRSAIERDFQVWLAQTVYPKARAAGVSRGVYDRAFYWYKA